MSIEVDQLTKLYSQQKAVDQVSFQISTGEIVGFLGPNGAGKSTTMKMLCGYLPPSKGVAKICGLNVVENEVKIKQKIGYLPEHNPLYLDMYVSEFLDFSARLCGLKKPKDKVNELIKKTGLTKERKKKIGQLSKGYRQRVGLAQALIHDPEVLILDEPTSGLDPNQVQEIRNLILEIGKDKTVLLSTHIMQEVEAMCSRVIIINQGQIMANGSVQEIKKQITGKTSVVFIVSFRDEVEEEKIGKLKGVESVVHMSANKFKVTAAKGVDLASVLFKFAVDNNTIICEQKEESNSLESVFYQLTNA